MNMMMRTHAEPMSVTHKNTRGWRSRWNGKWSDRSKTPVDVSRIFPNSIINIQFDRPFDCSVYVSRTHAWSLRFSHSRISGAMY